MLHTDCRRGIQYNATPARSMWTSAFPRNRWPIELSPSLQGAEERGFTRPLPKQRIQISTERRSDNATKYISIAPIPSVLHTYAAQGAVHAE